MHEDLSLVVSGCYKGSRSMRSLRDCWAKRQFEESIRPRPREVISFEKFISASIALVFGKYNDFYDTSIMEQML